MSWYSAGGGRRKADEVRAAALRCRCRRAYGYRPGRTLRAHTDRPTVEAGGESSGEVIGDDGAGRHLANTTQAQRRQVLARQQAFFRGRGNRPFFPIPAGLPSNTAGDNGIRLFAAGVV